MSRLKNWAEVGADCISRQAAIDLLHMHLMYRMGTDSNKKRLDDWINSVPAAQSEIIHCKDCKHWDGVDTCDVIDAPVWDNDFCSMAERRSNE